MDDQILSFFPPPLTELDERHQPSQTHSISYLYLFVWLNGYIWGRRGRISPLKTNKQGTVSLTRSAKTIRHYTTCSASLLSTKGWTHSQLWNLIFSKKIIFNNAFMMHYCSWSAPNMRVKTFVICLVDVQLGKLSFRGLEMK